MNPDVTRHTAPPSKEAEARRRAALANPNRVYDRPMDVLEDPSLDDPTRRRILRGWALDEQRLMVSTEENMAGGRPNRLADVMAALRALDTPRAPTGTAS